MKVSSPCYIFGYGSLISADSRDRTAPSAEWLAVTVKGFQRSWADLGGHCQKMCSVAVMESKQDTTNGVIFEIDQEDLSAFDEREKGYHRVPIDPANIKVIDGKLKDYTVWVYTVDSMILPHQNAPIAQSYLDVILDGAIRISVDFAQSFIDTTTGWNQHWINDREQPRYLRPLRDNQYHAVIDRLLHSKCNKLEDS